MNMEEERENIKEELEYSKSDIKKEKLIKKTKASRTIYFSGNKPEWMILTSLPVIPPDLRPLSSFRWWEICNI